MNKNMKTKFYVIVPIYNVGTLISKCLKSIYKQRNLKNIKVIAINDQSPKWNIEKDIIENFRKKRKLDIVVLENKANSGLGPTRNVGIEYIKNNEKNASTDYVLYIDPDDFFLKNKFQKISRKIKKNKYPDILRFSFCFLENNKKFVNNKPIVFNNKKNDSLKKWNKFPEMTFLATYKIDFIIENNINFPNVRFPHEDVYFSLVTSCLAKNIVSSNLFVYCYNNQRDGSITSVYKKNKPDIETKINWVKSVVFYLWEAFDFCLGKSDSNIMRFYFSKFEYIFADYRSKGYNADLIKNDRSKYLEIYNKLECDYFLDSYKNKIVFNKNVYKNSENSFLDFWVKVKVKMIIFNLWNELILLLKKRNKKLNS